MYERNLEERKEITEVNLNDVTKGMYSKKGYDVLVYNDDKFGRLDSYRHFDGKLTGLSVSSGQGGKIIVVVCNAPE